MKNLKFTLLMLWCAVIASAQTVFADAENQPSLSSSHSNNLTTSISSDNNRDQNSNNQQLLYSDDAQTINAYRNTKTDANNTSNINHDQYHYDSSHLRWGWNIDAQVGVSVFYGAPLGCAHTLSKIRPTIKAHLGKWFTPSVGSRLTWEWASMKAADMYIHHYQTFHMDLLWNLAPMISEKENFTLAPYFGTGCVWNQTIGHAPMALSYGVTASVNISKHLSVVMEFGMLSTFKYFDGITRGCNEPQWDYRHPRLGENIANFSVGLSYRIPGGKKSNNKGWNAWSNERVCFMSDGYEEYCNQNYPCNQNNYCSQNNQGGRNIESSGNIQDNQNIQDLEKAENLDKGQKVPCWDKDTSTLMDNELASELAVENINSRYTDGPLYTTEELLAAAHKSNVAKKAEEEKQTKEALEKEQANPVSSSVGEGIVEDKFYDVSLAKDTDLQNVNGEGSELANHEECSESNGVDMCSESFREEEDTFESKGVDMYSEILDDEEEVFESEGVDICSGYLELLDDEEACSESEGVDMYSELFYEDEEAYQYQRPEELTKLSHDDKEPINSEGNDSLTDLSSDVGSNNASPDKPNNQASDTQCVTCDKEGRCPNTYSKECKWQADSFPALYAERIRLSAQMEDEIKSIYLEFNKLNSHENLKLATNYDFESTGDPNVDENICLWEMIENYWDLTDRLMHIFRLDNDSVTSDPYVTVNERVFDMEYLTLLDGDEGAEEEYKSEEEYVEEEVYIPDNLNYDDKEEYEYEEEYVEEEVYIQENIIYDDEEEFEVVEFLQDSCSYTQPYENPISLTKQTPVEERVVSNTFNYEPAEETQLSADTIEYSESSYQPVPEVYRVDKKGNIIEDITEEYNSNLKQHTSCVENYPSPNDISSRTNELTNNQNTNRSNDPLPRVYIADKNGRIIEDVTEEYYRHKSPSGMSTFLLGEYDSASDREEYSYEDNGCLSGEEAYYQNADGFLDSMEEVYLVDSNGNILGEVTQEYYRYIRSLGKEDILSEEDNSLSEKDSTSTNESVSSYPEPENLEEGSVVTLKPKERKEAVFNVIYFKDREERRRF